MCGPREQIRGCFAETLVSVVNKSEADTHTVLVEFGCSQDSHPLGCQVVVMPSRDSCLECVRTPEGGACTTPRSTYKPETAPESFHLAIRESDAAVSGTEIVAASKYLRLIRARRG